MKPDWKDAPEWANYLAMDEDGSWWWFENEPYTDGDAWCHDGGDWQIADIGVCWDDSLTKRPIEEQ